MTEQAIKDLRKELYLMMHKTLEMLELTENGFMKNKPAALDQADELAKEIQAKEDALTAMFAETASTKKEARALLSIPSHIENIAASIKRITESSRKRIKEGLLFSDKAILEISKLFAGTKDILKKSGEAILTDAEANLETTLRETNNIQRMSTDFATAHEERLVTGKCAPKSSTTYLCILYAFEDIGTHAKEAVKKISGK